MKISPSIKQSNKYVKVEFISFFLNDMSAHKNYRSTQIKVRNCGGFFSSKIYVMIFHLDLLDYNKVTVIHIPPLGPTLRLLHSISCVASEFGKKYTTVS